MNKCQKFLPTRIGAIRFIKLDSTCALHASTASLGSREGTAGSPRRLTCCRMQQTLKPRRMSRFFETHPRCQGSPKPQIQASVPNMATPFSLTPQCLGVHEVSEVNCRTSVVQSSYPNLFVTLHQPAGDSTGFRRLMCGFTTSHFAAGTANKQSFFQSESVLPSHRVARHRR